MQAPLSGVPIDANQFICVSDYIDVEQFLSGVTT